MYFAMDKGDVASLANALAEQIDASPMEWNWYALMDAGFDYNHRPLQLATANWPLYFQPEWGELRAVSPLLIECPRQNNAIPAKLLRHSQGRPMLGFVASVLDVETLRDIWQRSLSLTTADGQPYILRFADTRIAATLPQTLSPPSWRRLCAPLTHWLIVDRAGTLQALDLAPSHQAVDEKDSWELTEPELAGLLRSAEPDALANRLSQDFAELLPASGAFLHHCLQRSCAALEEHHIENAPDQLMLAVAACLSQGRILDDPRLPQVLQSHALQKDGLGENLASLLDDISAL